MFIKKLTIFIFTVTVLLSVPVFSCAYNVDVSAECAVVINSDTLEILYSKNAFKKKSMASTTKIMTSLIAIESGRLNEKVTVRDAIHSEGSSIGLKEGNTLTLEALVYGMMLESGNDAAEVTAEFFSGSEERFSELMNRKAGSIGMLNTNFVTSSGLDDDNHYSTAYDMALLGAYAIRNPVFIRFCSEKEKTVSFVNPQFKTHFSNHNKLLGYCAGVFGVKTGFTKKSGRCLVSACERDGITLVAVTLNAPDDWSDHDKLYNTAFTELKVTDADCSFHKNITVYGSHKASVYVKSNKDSYSFATLTDSKPEIKICLPEFIYAPVKAGDIIGEIRVCNDGKTIYSTPLIAQETADKIIGVSEIRRNIIQKIISLFSRKED